MHEIEDSDTSRATGIIAMPDDPIKALCTCPACLNICTTGRLVHPNTRRRHLAVQQSQ